MLKKISETKYGVKKIYIFFQKQFPKYNKKKLPHNATLAKP